MDVNNNEVACPIPVRFRCRQPDLEQGLGTETDDSPTDPRAQTTGQHLDNSERASFPGQPGRTQAGPEDNATVQDTTATHDALRQVSSSTVGSGSDMSSHHDEPEHETAPSAARNDFDAWNKKMFVATAMMRRNNRLLPGLCLDLSAMQMLTLRRLQSKLVRQALEHLYSDDEDPTPAWLQDDADYASSTMRQYVMALQDYDYMAQHADFRRPDPFRVGFYLPDRRSCGPTPFADHAMLKKHLWSIAEAKSDAKRQPPREILSDIAVLGCARVRRPDSDEERMAWRRAPAANKLTLRLYLKGFGSALAVSTLLVLPMLVIILFFPAQAQAAVVATACIVFFALGAAMALKDVFRVVSATAAYAAVLVVFVAAH